MKKQIIFFRHAKPNIKIIDKEKGVKFIGRREDPSIILPDKIKILQFKKYLEDFDYFISSPIKRCKESISLLTSKEIIENILLLEIDYGEADGIYINDLKSKYPYLFEEWRDGKDPRFPGGENNLDVVRRIKLFVNQISKLKSSKIAVCTHNVFLRCLIGSSLRIPAKNWYKIEIPYFEPIVFSIERGKLIYKGSFEQKRRFLDKLYAKEVHSYFIALIPEKELFLKIYKEKKEIFNKFGDQKYLKDPPHTTLYVSSAKDLKEVKESIKITISKEKIILGKIINEYQEFKEDQFAGGGTSIALKFDNRTNKKIIALQRKLITKLNILRGDKIHPRYMNKDLPLVLKNNINKYGFPFVGQTLIPHINFCCFKLPIFAEKFKQLRSPVEFSGNFKFTKLGLFKLYNDDKIELMELFNLQ